MAPGNLKSGDPIQTVEICLSLHAFTILSKISLDCTCNTSPPNSVTNFKMVQQITLPSQINPIHTLFRSLHIQSNESRIISRCQSRCLSDNSSRCFLMTTDTCQKFFMPQPDSYSHHHFILHLLLYPKSYFLQSQLTQL